MVDNFVNSQRIFRILSPADSLQNLLQNVIKDPTALKARRYLVKYNFHKLYQFTSAQQRQIKRAWTKENVIMVDDTVCKTTKKLII